MKFKENAIKPGMVIHCPKEEDARALFEKIGQDTENCFWNEYAEKTCYKIRKMPDENFQVSYQSTDYFNSYDITEFSDLIEPDEPQMSAVEVVEWLSHFVSYDDYGSVFERLHDEYGDEYGFTDLVNEYTPEEIVRKITAYEAAKKEKPVEVELAITV